MIFATLMSEPGFFGLKDFRILLFKSKHSTMSEMKYADLTHKIIGSAMEVHKTLGNGFQEVIYQRALAIEFKLRNLEFTREHEMEIFYKLNSIGTRRVDFLEP